MARVYGDQWGSYNGLYYSSWSVNPPNPTGYAPQMVACMNDPGTGAMSPDPAYNPAYSDFCYEWSFMPGLTSYMDTPVIPTPAFADGYNLPDSEYPDATPAILRVDGDGMGPWSSGGAAGSIATIQLTNGGSGYTSTPTVGFSSGTAKATAAISGSVTSLHLVTGRNWIHPGPDRDSDRWRRHWRYGNGHCFRWRCYRTDTGKRWLRLHLCSHCGDHSSRWWRT